MIHWLPSNIGKEAFTLLLGKLGKMAKGNMHRLETIKKQNYLEKTHLLLRILAVTGRYGPHLMIVMIFVIQNNI